MEGLLLSHARRRWRCHWDYAGCHFCWKKDETSSLAVRAFQSAKVAKVGILEIGRNKKELVGRTKARNAQGNLVTRTLISAQILVSPWSFVRGLGPKTCVNFMVWGKFCVKRSW